jgi:hypothetical protein
MLPLTVKRQDFVLKKLNCEIFFCGLECVGHSFAYVAHFVFLRDVWIRTQRVAGKGATNLVTYHPRNMVWIRFRIWIWNPNRTRTETFSARAPEPR